jgi:hypothetical protein
MKYAFLALAGAVASKDLMRLNTYDPAYVQFAEGLGSDEETNLQISALSHLGEPCVYLDETAAELAYQMDMFSRTLDPRHWTNVLNINKALPKPQRLSVHTWELYDKAFSFPRIRRYQYVQENMDMLEHFEDNLNANISNSQHMANFVRVANTVRQNLNTKYHDGEFDDPGNHDPKVEAEAEPHW